MDISWTSESFWKHLFTINNANANNNNNHNN